MSAGWPKFWRDRACAVAEAPDKRVAAPPAWLLGVAIVASTAALLGTTEAPEPSESASASNTATYVFARDAIDGGFVELTRDQTTATFLVIVRAEDLGPDGVATTRDAFSASIDGTISTSDLDPGAPPPLVNVKLDTPNGIPTVGATHEQISSEMNVSFTGDCDDPKASRSCAARFSVTVSRLDQGENGGVVRFDWTFGVHTQIAVFGTTQGTLGPFDPPWTIEVQPP